MPKRYAQNRYFGEFQIGVGVVFAPSRASTTAHHNPIFNVSRTWAQSPKSFLPSTYPASHKRFRRRGENGAIEFDFERGK
jgi:hypothetical protein